ncbi:MAG: thioredoxin-like domain-containing protein [Acidimicrobiia bacterium]|nr:thioredoxin-like domain-containing protein [Acidimicrobiia bacterium]MDX2467302.1 thioredoxin-like domain-containing protein [Acidimicrobiia bacterium]
MRIFLASVALALIATACTSSTPASDSSTPDTAAGPIEQPAIVEQSYAGTTPAPEFPDSLDWLNTAEPIKMSELVGKVVLLDFWTYGCINCIHIIPDLKRLEDEYSAELVVIGVHSAKFLNEGETDNIRQVVQRYEIEHPVVNDADFEVWQTWGAQAWPSIAVVDPAGNVVGMHAGEGVYEVVQPVIQGLVDEFDEVIDRTVRTVSLESASQPNTVLSYPGKVTTGGGLLFVADSGHHRVFAVDPTDGAIVSVYGNGNAGFESGPALTAEFDSPQGLAFDEVTGTLYVADTNNHAIRQIDIDSGEVTTLSGTGQQGWPPAAGLLADARLNSPWGLTLNDGRLWIAMAGFHQIWVADLTGGVISPAVGSSLEGVANGSLTETELAQPSGLVFDNAGRLYYADSESSSIRWADALALDGTTGTLSGSDQNLFDFGDVDGVGAEARLQHPLGIVWDEVTGDLIIADTYNSKLKRINTTTGATTSYLGSDQGWADGTNPAFYEPGGIAISDRTLYVADTNNHVIRVVDLDTDETTTLVLHGIEAFTPPPEAADFPGTVIELAPTTLGAGDGTVVLGIELPEGYKVNDDAPSSVRFVTSGSAVSVVAGAEQSLTGAKLPVEIAVELSEGSSLITADVTLLYCRTDSEGLCIIEQIRFSQPVEVTGAGGGTVVFPHRVVLPEF